MPWASSTIQLVFLAIFTKTSSASTRNSELLPINLPVFSSCFCMCGITVASTVETSSLIRRGAFLNGSDWHLLYYIQFDSVCSHFHLCTSRWIWLVHGCFKLCLCSCSNSDQHHRWPRFVLELSMNLTPFSYSCFAQFHCEKLALWTRCRLRYCFWRCSFHSWYAC